MKLIYSCEGYDLVKEERLFGNYLIYLKSNEGRTFFKSTITHIGAIQILKRLKRAQDILEPKGDSQ